MIELLLMLYKEKINYQTQEHHLQVFLPESLNGNLNQYYSNNLWLKVYFPLFFNKFSFTLLLLRSFDFRTKGQGLPTLKLTY